MQTGKIQKIVLHVFPWEIDEFNRLADLFKRNSKYLDETDNIILDVSLNVSPYIINWEESKIPSDFYVDKFNSILKKFDWTIKNITDIIEDDSCLGCNDKRRNSLKDNDNVDIVTWVDTDIVFSDYHLSLLRRAFDSITDDYYIVTGQLPKMWDKYWDHMVHQQYKDNPYLNEDGTKPYHEYDVFEINPLVSNSLNDITVEKIYPFQLGGGFLTSFSSKLLDFIGGIPESLGSYGKDDTYILQCSMDMKQMGYDINQYSIVNSLISEDNLYKKYTHKDYLKLQDTWVNHNRKKSEENFVKECMKFRKNKLGAV
tara:strand:+ start:2535 stop:3473 length:939 start_codon:yes stop_codon:yes gene_type:complete